MPALCSLCVQHPPAVLLNTVLPTAVSPQPLSVYPLVTLKTHQARKPMNSTLSSVLNHTDTGERSSYLHFSTVFLLVISFHLLQHCGLYTVHFLHQICEKKRHIMTVCLYPQHPEWKVFHLASAVLPHNHIRLHMWTVWVPGTGWCRWWSGISGNRVTEDSAKKHTLLLLQWLGGLAVERLGVSVWGKHNECKDKHHQLFR